MKKNKIVSLIISLSMVISIPITSFSKTLKMPDIASKDPDQAAVKYAVNQNYLKLKDNFFMPSGTVSSKDFKSIMSKLGLSSSSKGSGNITRAEAAAAIVKAYGYGGSGTLSSSIKDKGSASSASQKYLAIAAENNLLKPVNVAGKLYMYPNREITRRELAVLIYQAQSKGGNINSSGNVALLSTASSKKKTTKTSGSTKKTSTTKKTTPAKKTTTPVKKTTTPAKTTPTKKAKTKKPAVVVVNPIPSKTKKTTVTPAKKPVTPAKPIQKKPVKPVKPVTPVKPTTNTQTDIKVLSCPTVTQSVYATISGTVKLIKNDIPKLYVNNALVSVNTTSGAWKTTVKLHGGVNSEVIKAVYKTQKQPSTVTKQITFNPTNPKLILINMPTKATSQNILIAGVVTDVNDSAPKITVNGLPIPVGANGGWSTNYTLSVGTNRIKIIAKNRYGTQTVNDSVVLFGSGTKTDASKPGIRCSLPDKTADTNITVSGAVYNTSSKKLQLDVNGILVNVASDYTFSVPLSLKEGDNAITITVSDESGNKSTFTKTVLCSTVNSNNAILSFKFEVSKNPSISTDVIGKIDQTTNTIVIDCPIDYTFVPTIIASDGSSVKVESADGTMANTDTPEDFFQPEYYVVTAQDGSTRKYVVNPASAVNQ